MTSISKNVYIDKLNQVVDKYNNTNHRTIKMKPVGVKLNIYFNSSQEINDEDPKFKIVDNVRISKHKNMFAIGYVPNWSKEVFMIKKVKKNCVVGYVVSDLNGEEIYRTFQQKEFQKANQKRV